MFIVVHYWPLYLLPQLLIIGGFTKTHLKTKYDQEWIAHFKELTFIGPAGSTSTLDQFLFPTYLFIMNISVTSANKKKHSNVCDHSRENWPEYFTACVNIINNVATDECKYSGTSVKHAQINCSLYIPDMVNYIHYISLTWYTIYTLYIPDMVNYIYTIYPWHGKLYTLYIPDMVHYIHYISLTW